MSNVENTTVSSVLKKKKERLLQAQTAKSAIGELIISVTILAVLLTVLFGLAAVDGNSMYPALRDGDMVVFYRLDKNIKAGDVVTFMADDTRCIKRVVAIGGDKVDIDDESGFLLVNGVVTNDDIFYETRSVGDNIQYPYTVPEDSIFVLGDNRTDSTDSRYFGAISLKDVRGKIVVVLRTRFA